MDLLHSVRSVGKVDLGVLFGRGDDMSSAVCFLKAPFTCYPVYCGDLVVRCTLKSIMLRR